MAGNKIGEAVIHKGDPVPLNTVHSKEMKTLTELQTKVGIEVYRSTEREVEDPNAMEVKFLGSIIVELPKTANAVYANAHRTLTVEMVFGGTELKVSGITADGGRVEAKLDLLA